MQSGSRQYVSSVNGGRRKRSSRRQRHGEMEIEDHWKTLKNVIVEASKEILGYAKKENRRLDVRGNKEGD